MDKTNIIQVIRERHSDLSLKDIMRVLPSMQIRRIRKKEVVTDTGPANRFGFFVLKGLFRAYNLDGQGQESTFLFIGEREIFGDVDSIFGVDNFYSPKIEALEDSLVIWVDVEELKAIIRNDMKLRDSFDREVYAVIGRIYRLYRSQINEKPELRYLNFLEEQRAIINRLSQKHIASYLGVTPESFSRLKTRILNKQRK